MQPVHSFAPIATARARVLVLGSMPGAASLAAGQYYAHRHNAFWRIFAALLEFEPDAGYRQRVRRLQQAGIAVWDVLASCHRPGSLDADIDRTTVVVNDFEAFFARHARIGHVFFNGAAAESHFRRHVLPSLSAYPLHYRRLPSTSPAHASLRFEQKRDLWLASLRAVL